MYIFNLQEASEYNFVQPWISVRQSSLFILEEQGSMYLYSFIGLINEVPSVRFLINSNIYCSLCRVQKSAHSSQLIHLFIIQIQVQFAGYIFIDDGKSVYTHASLKMNNT